MSENILPPRIKFYQNHRPAMDPGDYAVVISNKITHNSSSAIATQNEAQVTRRFSVYGERFSLNDQDIRALFPSAGSTGEYASYLPHIIFNRNTLPWERHALASNHDLPWLALLLFDEDERPAQKSITLAELKNLTGDAGDFPAFAAESAQHDDDLLTVIDVPKTVLQKILPTTSGLLLLAHTRQGIDDNHAPVGEENAVVFCNRLPAQGKRSTMHLVSLEGRYDASGFIYTADKTVFRLVSLKSWEFYAIEHFKITTDTLAALSGKASNAEIERLSTLLDQEFAGTEAEFLTEAARAAELATIPESYQNDLIQGAKFEKTFDGLLKHLNKDILTLRLPIHANATAERFMGQGLVPMKHHFRSGDTSVSWCRGPFVPYRPAQAAVQALYPETADELLIYHGEEGMFDVTYAAAWELGRLLALNSKDFSVSQYQWKRQLTQAEQLAVRSQAYAHLPVFGQGGGSEADAQLWENHIRPWLDDVVSFQSIPANYLLPDVGLLPRESIRFFHVDRDWLIAAVSGAFSIGGDWDRDRQTGQNTFTDYLSQFSAPQTGFLLRSDVVQGWPGLLVDGYDASDNKIAVTKRLLERDLVLYLFETDVRKVIFHQKPEVMHFGLLQDNDQFFKLVRDDDGTEVGNPLPVDWQSTQADRVIDIPKLATTLGKAGRPAHFAMNMVEGVPEVIFNVG
jgi:hypothetical protein